MAGLVVVVVVGACRDGSSPRVAEARGPGTTLDVVGGVPVAEPAAGFARQCAAAATTLGFAVPCPTRLPLVTGRTVDCSDSCVAASRTFFLEVGGDRHLIVEARERHGAPPSPCYGGAPAGTVEVNGQELLLLTCPPSTPELEANVRHGEGAHVEHVLGYWDRAGVRYAVSVHGTDEAAYALLEEVASSIALVDP